MAFDFKDQLKVGTRGEELFLENYHEPLILIPDRYADFKRIRDGKTIELKSDQYNMDKTPNFFFERWSVWDKDTANRKPGGPWQSRKNRVDLYIYMFVRHNTYFQFDSVKKLCDILDDMTKGKGLIFVKNKGWITAGYTVPRADLAEVYKEYTFGNKKTNNN